MSNLVTYGYGGEPATIIVNISAESILAGQLFLGNTLVPISTLDNVFREKRGTTFTDGEACFGGTIRGSSFKEKRGTTFCQI